MAICGSKSGYASAKLRGIWRKVLVTLPADCVPAFSSLAEP